MNIVPVRFGSSSSSANIERAPANEIDAAISELFQVVRKHPFVIVITVLLSLAAAGIYLAARENVFQSTATLMIDPARPNILASQQVMDLQTVDSGVVDSVVEIIKSDFVGQDVAKRLQLANDPEFMRESGIQGWIRPIRDFIKAPKPLTQVEVERAAASAALKHLDVRRIGLTYVVEVSAKSADPALSARLSNAFVDAYLENEMTVKLNMAKKASSWLDNRTAELRARLVEADAAVQQYRVTNNLIDPKEGKLPLDQQTAELTTNLSEVRAKQTTAVVLAKQVSSLIEQGDYDSAAIAAPPETAIRKIRDSVIELASREQDLASRVGRQHRLTVNARNETEAARVQLRDEVKKYQESLQNDAASAIVEVAQLEAELGKLNLGQFEVGEKSIQLRELERNVESARLLYETFLTRLKEMRQQETMPMQDARVIASAIPATNPSNLSTALVLGCALGSGLLGGLLMALLRERFDPAIRNVRDAETATGLRVLTTLGEVPKSQRRDAMANAVPNRLLTYAVDQPFSPFAESFQHLRFLLNRYTTGGAKVVGIVAVSPGEGKSTIACNLAHLNASRGVRTILIDCDLRNPALSEQLSPAVAPGLPDVLMGHINWIDAIQVDATSNLSLLTGKGTRAIGNPADLLAQPALDRVMESISKSCDMVILDLAPIAAYSDARVVASIVDIFVLVVESGKTHKTEVQNLQDHAPEVYEKTVGVVLNRAQLSEKKQRNHSLQQRPQQAAAA